MWHVDKNGELWREYNGKRQSYDETTIGVIDCHSSGLNHIDTPELCCEFMACILNERRDLDACLHLLSNDTLFKPINRNMALIDPLYAVAFLEAIGAEPSNGSTVHDPRYGTITLPYTFEHWYNEVLLKSSPNCKLSANCRKVILNNKPLLDYIRDMISFVTVNPAIINRNMGSNVNTEIGDPRDSTLVKPFIPLTRFSGSDVDATATATAAIQTIAFALESKSVFDGIPTPTMVNPHHINGPYPNVVSLPVAGYGLPHPYSRVMAGGVQRGGVNNNETILNELLVSLEKSGFDIDAPTKQKFMKLIKNVAKAQQLINEYFQILSVLTTLTNLPGLRRDENPYDAYNADNKRVISFEAARNHQELLKYLYANMRNYTDSINHNANYINEGTKIFIDSAKQLLRTISSDDNQQMNQRRRVMQSQI